MTNHQGRPPRERLTDIIAAIARIKQAEQQLVAAEQVLDEAGTQVAYDAVLYNLVVIGEAVRALPVSVTESRADVPWRDIVDMRNFLSHEYFRVSANVVRRTLDQPLEQLRMTCVELHAEEYS